MPKFTFFRRQEKEVKVPFLEKQIIKVPLLKKQIPKVPFLFKKTKTFLENMENSIMSESSLKKDWLSPEEEEAWEDL